MRSALHDRQLEQRLVARAKDGDHRALEELLSSHYEKMLAVALKYTRSPDNAQDAVQDACIQCIRHISKFREESSFRTWVTRITVNCALMHGRKNKRLIPVGTVVEDKHASQVPKPRVRRRRRAATARGGGKAQGRAVRRLRTLRPKVCPRERDQ